MGMKLCANQSYNLSFPPTPPPLLTCVCEAFNPTPQTTHPPQWAGPSAACEVVRRPGDVEETYEAAIWGSSRLNRVAAKSKTGAYYC